VTVLRGRTFGFLAIAALAIGACGNDGDASQGGKQLLRGIVAGLKPGTKAPSGPATPKVATPEVVEQALATTKGPLALITLEQSNTWAFAVESGANQGYRTFLTATQQTLTVNRGIVTATRGLGGDLMSSDISASGALVSARKAGTATKVMRFLDGEDQTIEAPFSCTISIGKTETVTSGHITRPLTQVKEACTYATLGFTNHYLVDRDGTAIASRQWIGRVNGYATFSYLRQ
jgi:hypothetical protein